MFQQLKALVAKSPLAMMVADEGAQLRVTITQKKAGKGGVPLSLSIIATPEELDRDLPGAITAAANEVAKPTPVADQVKAQVDAARQPAEKGKKKKGAKSAKTAKTKPLRQATKPKHKAKASAKLRLPGKPRKAAAATPAARTVKLMSNKKDGVKHHANRPDKAACIADYLDSCPKVGDTIKREDFLKKKGGTGRRFERLWDMSWQKFVKAAEAARGKKPAAPASAPAAPKDSKPPAQSSAKRKPAVAATPGDRVRAREEQGERRAAALLKRGTETQLSMLPDTWPFPTTPKDVTDKRAKDDTRKGYDIYNEKGTFLFRRLARPELDDELGMPNEPLSLRVFAIDGCRVMVKSALPPAQSSAAPQASPNSAASAEAERPAAAAEDEVERVDTSKPHPPRVVRHKTKGHLVAGGFTKHVQVGEILNLGGRHWTVASMNEQHINVEEAST